MSEIKTEPDFRLKSVWVFTAIDPKDNSEGVIGLSTPMGMMPAVAGDERRRDLIYPLAKNIAKARGITVKMIKFSVREDLETFEGSKQ